MASELKKERKDILLALIALICIILLVAIVGFFMLESGPEIVQGQVEVDEFRVSSKVPSRVLKLSKQEGDIVHVGDTLAVLDAPDVMAKLEQAEAARAAAEAQNEKAINGTRKEQVQGAFEMWQKAKAGLEVAEKTYERVNRLFNEGVVAAQKFDETKAMRDAALATERAAKSQYEMALNGAQREDKMAAKALVSRAKGAVDEVNSYINETYLIAPCDGEVSTIYPQLGELVGSGAPIMSINIQNSMWITFNVREDLLTEIKQGKVIKATVPALGDKEIELKVYYMKDLGTYAAWKATKPVGQFDLKTFEVRARPEKKIEDLRAGMSVIYKK